LYRYNKDMNRDELIHKLERETILKTPGIKKALIEVDRSGFVPEELKNLAYQDIPLPIGEDQTISQPGTVVFMLELLQALPGEKILEIGAGSGWVTALLAKLVGKQGFVNAFEINEKIGEFGKSNLEKNKIVNYRYEIGDAKKNWHRDAPYDKVIAGAGLPFIYPELYEIVKKGGTIVVPTRNFDIRRITKSVNTGEINQEIYYGYIFVPLK
jgi:protein-L-isoaspartate(D-aspartate) O-methyltransferase